MKEIHFYTNLRNEVQIEDEYITDVLTDWVSTNNAINDTTVDIVRTTQLSFLRNSWDYIDKGYEVFIHNYYWVIKLEEHMDLSFLGNECMKDIKRGNDISRMLIGGTFGKLE